MFTHTHTHTHTQNKQTNKTIFHPLAYTLCPHPPQPCVHCPWRSCVHSVSLRTPRRDPPRRRRRARGLSAHWDALEWSDARQRWDYSTLFILSSYIFIHLALFFFYLTLFLLMFWRYNINPSIGCLFYICVNNCSDHLLFFKITPHTFSYFRLIHIHIRLWHKPTRDRTHIRLWRHNEIFNDKRHWLCRSFAWSQTGGLRGSPRWKADNALLCAKLHG